MANRIILNETSYFGRGARENLATEIKSRGFQKVLVVTDESLLGSGVTKFVIDELESKAINYDIYSNVKPNPTVDNVLEGLNVCESTNADALVAVGGGSVIDTAKAIGIIRTNPEFSDVVSLDGVAETKNKSLPIIAIPTTAGTAAEVTINYVITDEVNKKKMVCVDPHDIPVVAIIDPDFMDGMPKSLAAATGMDALTHAMEGYITKGAWLMTDMYNLNAMALIYKNLDRAVNDKDQKAIEQVAYGQYITGMGFSNGGLGIVHSMAHSLGAMYDTPHGLANAMLLPTVLRFNGEVCPELYINMGNALGLNMSNVSEKEAVETVVNAVRSLAIKVGIPQTLESIGVKEEDLPALAEQALNDVCTGGNPRYVTKEDILNLFKGIYN